MRQMRINKPSPPFGDGVGPLQTRWRREFSYPQESLPKAIEILLCLLDGAERRRRILLGVDSPGGTSNTLLIRLCPPRGWLRGQ